ncbi:hypothetical protein ACHHRT_01615 [Desulfurivibrio sp. D14AmB]|uniref:hypothetical protein n=1 Tax=Desulfurivibrio sp. D14AmB TaxID=3374370 RepID=UPI00376EAA71
MPRAKTVIAAILMVGTMAAATTMAMAAKHLGTAGQTFDLAEKDALAEIMEAAARVDWESVFDKEKMRQTISQYRPTDLRTLPKTQRDRVFLVDMTYSLEMDIPDGKGGILYPKGFTFNPLDYVSMTSIFVVINGSDPLQVEWFSASDHADDFRVRLILTDGDYIGLIRALERPVFYLSPPMADRFRLTSVPSVVRQKGRFIEVQEVYVEDQQEQP